MRSFLKGWDWPTIFKFLVLPNASFGLIAYFTDAPFLIGILNFMIIPLSTAIVIAFAPEVIGGFRVDKPNTKREFIICLGILVSWAEWDHSRLLSLLWRTFPSMRWIIDSDFNSFILFWVLCAAVCHLQAPQVINGTIPRKAWIKLGFFVGFSVFVILFAVLWRPASVRVSEWWHGSAPSREQYVAATDDAMIDALKHYGAEGPPDDKGPFAEPLTARISKDMGDRIELWRSDQTPIPSKSAAIRHLLNEALEAEDKSKIISPPGTKP